MTTIQIQKPKTMYGWLTQYQQSAPTDVTGLCRDLGIACHGKTMPDEVSGYIERVGDYDYQIVYNKRHAPVRQRFTIAHELGHYYLHRDILGKGTGDTKAYRSEVPGHCNADITPWHETEANAFAADLLMPKNLIQGWVKEGLGFEEIRSKLEVSQSALSFRLNNLGVRF